MNKTRTSQTVLSVAAASLLLLSVAYYFGIGNRAVEPSPESHRQAATGRGDIPAESVSTSVPEPRMDKFPPPARQQPASATSENSELPEGDWHQDLYPQLLRISELEHESAETALVELLPMTDSSDPSVRLAAIEAIGDMRLPGLAPVLTIALEDPHPGVRLAALEALEAQDDEAVAASIEIHLHDPSREVRLAAIDALAGLDAKSSVHALGGLLSDQDPEIRHRSVYAIGDIGGQSAATYLLMARDDADPAIREYARLLLAELGYEDSDY